MKKLFSFCVHSFDEAAALGRLVLSSLPFADLIDEWVILDHRSGDETPAVIEGLRPVLQKHGIHLTTLREERDLSRDFTFADVRTATIQAARNKLVVLHDADFILGPGFRSYLTRAASRMGGTYSTASYVVPVIWDRLQTDSKGIVRDHGRTWLHNRRPRIMRRDLVRYEQTKDGGRWEKLVRIGSQTGDLALSPSKRSPPARDAVVSVNVKPEERIALRDTMTMFMQDAVQGKAIGGWLDNHREGRTRSQGPYDYAPMNLRGWKLNVGALELAT